MKKVKILAIGLVVILSACKKKDDDCEVSSNTEVKEKSRSEILTSNLWAIDKYTEDGKIVVDESNDSNYIDLNTNGEYFVKNKFTDGTVFNSTWELIDNDNKWVINGDTSSLISFTSTSFSEVSSLRNKKNEKVITEYFWVKYSK